jgi:hypothetical protein
MAMTPVCLADSGDIAPVWLLLLLSSRASVKLDAAGVVEGGVGGPGPPRVPARREDPSDRSLEAGERAQSCPFADFLKGLDLPLGQVNGE